MTPAARQALRVIRQCIEDDGYSLTMHFTARMIERGLFWPDIHVVFHKPQDMQSPGMDKYLRPKWIIRGAAATGDLIAIVCVVEMDETHTEFITLYWEDP